MNRTEYKNNFYKEHYERINLAVPKGMKDIIRTLAADKGMSINAYIQDLVRKDQCGMFDTMQVAEKNREMISGITGNMQKCVLHKISKVLHKTPVFVLVTCVLPVSYRNIFVCFEGV